MRSVVVAVMCQAALSAGQSAADKIADVRTTVAIRAEAVEQGMPTEPAWAKARPAGPMLVAGMKRLPSVRTMLWTLCDDTALYVKARCDDPNAAKLRSEKRDDQNVFLNDCVELFLGSPDSADAMVHLAVDVLGQRFGNFGGHTPKTPWRSRVRRDAKGFTVWAAVPYTAVAWLKPARGDCWRIKVGRESKTGGGNSMWPFNPEPGFHADPAWGAVYFHADNLAPNGQFEQVARAKRTERPEGWALVNGNRKWGIQGTAGLVASPLPRGGRAVRLHKTVAEAWYPQLLMAKPAAVHAGRTYEASAWVRCDRAWNFRYILSGTRPKPTKRAKPFGPSPKQMRHVAFTFVVPPDRTRLSLGFNMTNTTGELIVDNVRLRRVPTGLSGAPGSDDTRAHPIHRLVELSRRTRIMPREHVRRGETYACERVVFADTATGATIWKMTRAPGYTRHTYSNMSPWNADGSMLMLRSDRDQRGKGWVYLMPSDGPGIRAVNVGGTYWCPVHPDRLFYRVWSPNTETMEVGWYNPRTGRTHAIGQVPRGGMIPPSHDGRKLLVVRGGYSATSRKSVGCLIDVETGSTLPIDFGYTTHQVWFTKRPDYTISFNYESRNKHYKESGGGSWLVNADGTNRRRVRKKHCSHRGFSPDGKRVAFHGGGGIRVMNVDGSDEKVVARVGGGHLSWQVTPEWLVVTAGNAIRAIGMQGQGFRYRIACPNTQIGFSEYLTEAHLDSSPDGTKIAFASSMLGDTDFYQAIARLPGPPRNVRARRDGRTVHLAWDAPRFHKEVRGYLVYRSDSSGLDYRQVTPRAVGACAYTDTVPPDLARAYYVVTGLEHSGLEGRPSAEVCAAASGRWEGRVRHYYELEDAAPRKPLMEHFDARASAWYVLRMDSAEGGSATLTVHAPREATYHLWSHARSPRRASVTLACAAHKLEPVTVRSAAYGWQCLGDMRLGAGQHAIDLACTGEDLRLDALFLTDHPNITPMVDGLWDISPPGAPQGLRATVADAYAVRLAWQPVASPDLAHYNVYASTTRAFVPRQEQLVASPKACAYTDWGLQQGTTYYYRVTAVDRRGNESDASAEVAAATKPGGGVLVRKVVGKPVVQTPELKGRRRLAEKDLERMGALAERAHRLTADGALTVSFDVPREDRYLVWMKLAAHRWSYKWTLTVRLNGREVQWGPRFGFVSVGHAGPTPGVFMWDTLRLRAPDSDPRLHLKPGRLDLRIDPPAQGDVAIAEVVLTSDLGWQPRGVHGWLPVDPAWLNEPIPAYAPPARQVADVRLRGGKAHVTGQATVQATPGATWSEQGIRARAKGQAAATIVLPEGVLGSGGAVFVWMRPVATHRVVKRGLRIGLAHCPAAIDLQIGAGTSPRVVAGTWRGGRAVRAARQLTHLQAGRRYVFGAAFDPSRGRATLYGNALWMAARRAEPWSGSRAGRELRIGSDQVWIDRVRVFAGALSDEAATRAMTDDPADPAGDEIVETYQEQIDDVVCKKRLLYEDTFSGGLGDWVLEGGAFCEAHNGQLVYESPQRNGRHTVLWNKSKFPADFLCEYDFMPRGPLGLCIVFFCAGGRQGEDLFDPKLPERTGVFSQYTAGAINAYHISYYRVGLDQPTRLLNTRKNHGFYMVKTGVDPIPPRPGGRYRITVAKLGHVIRFAVDGKVVVRLKDDGTHYGPAWGAGRIGLRQMHWTRARYDNFRVYAVAAAKPD